MDIQKWVTIKNLQTFFSVSPNKPEKYLTNQPIIFFFTFSTQVSVMVISCNSTLISSYQFFVSIFQVKILIYKHFSCFFGEIEKKVLEDSKFTSWKFFWIINQNVAIGFNIYVGSREKSSWSSKNWQPIKRIKLFEMSNSILHYLFMTLINSSYQHLQGRLYILGISPFSLFLSSFYNCFIF